MSYKIIYNDTWTKDEILNFKDDIYKNDGNCVCMVERNEDTKCMCKDFRDKITNKDFYGECHCGLYVKTRKE